jgi:hypothetical protein
MAEPVKDARHWTVETNELVGDSINVSIVGRDEIHIEIDEPWAGSTETGFGATTGTRLDRQTVAALVEWLLENFLNTGRVA